jgi:predicted lipoprotein
MPDTASSSDHPAVSPRFSVPWPAWAAAAIFVALLIVYPPFRIVSKNARSIHAAAGGAGAAFEPKVFAEKFWNERLQPAASQAPEATSVLSAFRKDTAAALKTHARRVGLGNAAYVFLRGSGRVTAVERSRVLIDVDGAVVALRTGPVFGNSVRDGCGLIDVNDVSGLTEFNALSGELNRLVEERVQPALKSVAVGAAIRFAGCAEAPETLPASGPLLTFIPVSAEVTP